MKVCPIQRITGLDLQIITAELNKNILNYRLQNIYNVSNLSRQYLFKFTVPDSKKVLILDCGNKIHLTEFERQTTQTPSNFVTKLRKHLKTRRVSAIKQINNDRILVLQFSDGLFYLVLEFFSAGNILLLDENRKILSLQRMVNDKGDNDRYAVNEIYKIFDDALFTKDFKYEKKSYTPEQVSGWIQSQREKLEQNAEKKKRILSIHKLLFVNASHLSSDLIQKNLAEHGIVTSSSCFEFENDSEKLDQIIKVLDKSEDDYINILSNKDGIEGVIVSKKNPHYDPESESSDLEFVFDEFHPFKPYKGDPENYKFTEIKGYNKTLDSFFSTIESTKYALRIEQQKQQAAKRLDHARQERDKQIQSLAAQEDLNSKKADAIMFYADLVESCKDWIQTLIDQQIDWTNIESLIKLEQSRGREIVSTIKLPLNLKENKINLLLPDVDEIYDVESENSRSDSDDSSSSSDSDTDSDSDSDSDDGTRKTEKKLNKNSSRNQKQPKLSVWIDISLSPYANARLYFESKKHAESKRNKVEKSTSIALKNAQRKISQDLTKNLKNESETLKHIRPKYWFEKFFWFVSSEGYLCLAGRDDSQTDMIYFRHFNDNDYFVSSDVEGSLKVFIKNPFKGEGVPPSTLMQAGIFAISASSAWNGKVTTSAWVLQGPDISKKDFDGSLLSAGNFNYKAKKVYLPPSQLVMGFGFFWLGNEETASKYKEARLQREENHGLKIIMDNKKQDLDESMRNLGKIKSEKAEMLETIIEHKERKIEDYLQDAKQLVDEESNAPEENAENTLQSKVEESESSAEETSRESTPDPTQVKEGKKRLSAKERRMLRKGRTGLTPVNNDKFIDSILTQPNHKEAELSKVSVGSSTEKPLNVRGKKSKLKKIATKYADQDEEEKRLRMDALGTLKQIEELERHKQKEIEEKEKSNNKYVNDSLAAQRRKKQEEKEYQRYLMEEVNEDESSVTNYLEILDSFISKPQPNDNVYAAIPTFAPWASLLKFKYKVKIQPGNGKKGKCINDTLNYFTTRKLDPSRTDTDLDWENERDIIKATKSNDLVGTFTVNKVKLVLPGDHDNRSANKKNSSKKGSKKGKK